MQEGEKGVKEETERESVGGRKGQRECELTSGVYAEVSSDLLPLLSAVPPTCFIPGYHILTFCYVAFASYPEVQGPLWHLWLTR